MFSNPLDFKVQQDTDKNALDFELTISNLSFDGCSTAPLADYIHNPVYQELLDESDHDSNASDRRVYLDLRSSAEYAKEMEKLERNDLKTNLFISLKLVATKKLRLRI